MRLKACCNVKVHSQRAKVQQRLQRLGVTNDTGQDRADVGVVVEVIPLKQQEGENKKWSIKKNEKSI